MLVFGYHLMAVYAFADLPGKLKEQDATLSDEKYEGGLSVNPFTNSVTIRLRSRNPGDVESVIATGLGRTLMNPLVGLYGDYVTDYMWNEYYDVYSLIVGWTVEVR